METPNSLKASPEETMRILVDVFEVFKNLAHWLGDQPGFENSEYSCRMSQVDRIDDDWFKLGQGEGFEISWYAWGAPDPFTVVSFNLSVLFHAGRWRIESSVTGRAAQEEEEELEERVVEVDTDQTLEALRQAASDIFEGRSASMSTFRTRYS